MHDRYIEILTKVKDAAEFPMEGDKSVDLVAEMIDSGLLKGACINDARGVPVQFAIFGITTEGRDYLEKLKKQKVQATKKYKLLNFSREVILLAIGAAIGAIATTIVNRFL